MRNKLHVIGKEDNQTWESWFKKRPEGTLVNVSWQWRNNEARNVMNSFAAQGYFKKESSRGMDNYTRTDKPYKVKTKLLIKTIDAIT
jgi:hypothetical protein